MAKDRPANSEPMTGSECRRRGTFTAAHVDRLVFCRQVVSEAMRLFPRHRASDAFRSDRWCSAASRMALGPRPHSHVRFAPNTRLWEDPDAFDPDRFAVDKVQARSRYTLLPFGGGPRVSIGASFATVEAAGRRRARPRLSLPAGSGARPRGRWRGSHSDQPAGCRYSSLTRRVSR